MYFGFLFQHLIAADEEKLFKSCQNFKICMSEIDEICGFSQKSIGESRREFCMCLHVCV